MRWAGGRAGGGRLTDRGPNEPSLTRSQTERVSHSTRDRLTAFFSPRQLCSLTPDNHLELPPDLLVTATIGARGQAGHHSPSSTTGAVNLLGAQ